MVPLAQWHDNERVKKELQAFIFQLRMNRIKIVNTLKDAGQPIWILSQPITILTPRTSDSDGNTMLLIGHYNDLQRWKHNLFVAHSTGESSSWNVLLVQAYNSYTIRPAQERRRVRPRSCLQRPPDRSPHLRNRPGTAARQQPNVLRSVHLFAFRLRLGVPNIGVQR